MKIVSVGGGPAGLYFSILARKADPTLDITVVERNPPDATFGFGVVFSDETLGNLVDADEPTYAAMQRALVRWDDIHVIYKDQKVVSTGHGFCGMARLKLLEVLQQRAQELGVKLRFNEDVPDATRLDADLVLLADGVNSRARSQLAEHFRPSLDWRRCKFTWLGADMKLPAFTFIFRENEHGLFQVHAYPFDERRSTFIVECREETWRKAGLEGATDADTVAYMEKLFAPDLKGVKLLPNNSVWRTFPTVRNAQWFHRNMVLMGDAAHTAHFSIGSGTKLALEDAMALKDAWVANIARGVPAVLQAYQDARQPEVERIQRAAQTSLEWFENSHRYQAQPPWQLMFGLMTRSKRITHDNLQKRDPRLVASVDEAFARSQQAHGPVLHADGTPRTPAFTPFRLRGMTLHNRLVVSPMCQYSAVDGTPDDWHLVHLGSRAVGGAALVIAESTAVSAQGRITPGCTGMYRPEHVSAWKRVTDFVHRHSGSRIALQLGHAGRKASTHVPWELGGGPLDAASGAWETLGPSAVPYTAGWHTPRQMTRADMDACLQDYATATHMAQQAGFDMLELHMAHGYLLSTFLSPLGNLRTDAYGGDLAGRMKFPLEVLGTVRAAWPQDKPISVRISSTDWAEGGLSEADLKDLARALHKAGADIIDCSGGGVVPHQKPVYGRMFQVQFADVIRNEAHVPTMTVGNVQDVDQAHTIVAAGRADLVAMARAHLMDPYVGLHGAAQYGEDDQPWPKQYLAVKPNRRKGAGSAE